MSLFALTLAEIATLLHTEVPAGQDGSLRICGAASLEDAGTGDIAFFEHPKYLRALRVTKASVVLVPTDFAEELPSVALRVASPSASFSVLLDKLSPLPKVDITPGIHPSAVVHESAKIAASASIQACAVVEAGAQIGERTVIGPNVFVGRNVQIGEQCFLAAHVVVNDRCVLGSRVTIHSSTVVGSDGFGYRFNEGKHQKVIHRGHVQIDDDVEIGACTAIDRARFGRTWIQAGTKIDNLVQIAHNVTIGPDCLIISQTGISGSARLGQRVTLAGQVGVVGHVEIGDNVIVAAKSGISKDCPPDQTMMGMFSVPMKEARELVAHYHRLPKTAAKIKSLEDEVQTLKRLVAELIAAKQAVPADA